MIISREEFHQRMSLALMNVKRTVNQKMPVDILYQEIQKDAPFRNHTYLFKAKDFTKLPLQEESVGIKKKHKKIKFEAERMAYIDEELILDTYEPVKVMCDIDYPSVLYVEDGFHRIFMANKLKMKEIRCTVKYGKFSLPQSISFDQLIELVDMMSAVLGKENKLKDIHAMLLRGRKNKVELMRTTLCYGKDK